MPAFHGLNILTAVLLFLFSSVFMYIFWYILFGRKQGKRNLDPEKDRDNVGEKEKKGRWGVDKNAYCYPKINDVMGFEFVKVVKVNQDSSSVQQKADNKPSWEESRGIGGLTAISSTETRQEREEDEPYPETGTTRRPLRGKQQSENEETIDESDITQLPFTEDEMKASAFFSSDWPSRGDCDSVPDDDALDHLLDNNGDLIEEPHMDKEQENTAREIEELQRIYNETERKDYGDQIDDLLNDEMDDFDDQDVDFENDDNQITADDMPDTE